MKQKSIITLVIILAAAGVISYGIIWFRKKASSAVTVDPLAGSPPAPVIAVPGSGVGFGLPPINSYAWWLNKLGHASFPLKRGSLGIEVYKMQETLNDLVITRKLNIGAIAEDGLFGPNTEARLALLFGGIVTVTDNTFRAEFDKLNEIPK